MKLTIEHQETTVEFTGHELRELLVLAALKEAGFSRGQYALDATVVEVLQPSDRRTNSLGRYRVRLITSDAARQIVPSRANAIACGVTAAPREKSGGGYLYRLQRSYCHD